jgi:hypothetical protein
MLFPSPFLHSHSSTVEAQTSSLSKPINISNNTANSYSPDLVVSEDGNDSVYVVWTNNSTGNGDVYFKRIAEVLVLVVRKISALIQGIQQLLK